MKIKNRVLTVAGAVVLALSAGNAHAIKYQPEGALGVGKDTLVPATPPDAAASAAVTKVAGTPIYVSADGIGEALHFPYYSARDEKRSVFNITNTSGETVVVKVIVREGKKSNHVLDFTIVMSPYDVWAGLIRGATAAEAAELTQRAKNGEIQTFPTSTQFAEGHPVLVRPSSENTCVVAAFDNDRTGAQLAYTIEPLNHVQITSVDVDSMKEGYINFIASGKVDTTGVVDDTATTDVNELTAANALATTVKKNALLHTAAGCTAIAKAVFTPGDGDGLWTTFSPDTFFQGAERAGTAKNTLLVNTFAPAGNVLKGNFNLIDADGGLGAGNQAMALANFNQSGENLVTIHGVPYLYEPTLASSNGLWNASGLDDVEDALSSHRVINEWINNPNNKAYSEWIQTFPTKGFYTNGTLVGTNPAIQRNKWRQALLSVTTQDPVSGVYPAPSANTGTNPFLVATTTGSSELVAFIDMYPYDREENRLPFQLRPSPAPYEESVLPNEVNVISFEDVADFSARGTTALLGSRLGTNFDLVDAFNDKANNGWLTVMYPEIDANFAFAGESYDMRQSIQMPVTGFMFKSIKRDAAKSYNMIIDHSNVTDRDATGAFLTTGEEP